MKDPARHGEVLDGVLAEIVDVSVWDQRARGGAQQHLIAVRSGAQPRGVVNVDAPIGSVALLGLTGVHAHSDPHRAAIRPAMLGERDLRRTPIAQL
jgi:hypothetical protein